MSPLVRRIVPKVAGAIVRGPLKRIADRRAAKGGKLVLWWRRTFGEIDADKAGDSLEEFAKDYWDKRGK